MSILLEARARLAAEAGAAEMQLGRFTFELKSHRRAGFFPFQNADIRGAFDHQAFGGWNLEIVVRATYLATHELESALALPKQIAEAFGKIRNSGRLRRVDCAADFAAFPLTPQDADALVTKRSKVAEFRAEAKDLDEVETALQKPALRVNRDSTSRVTGFAVSAGNPISARMYDKTAELCIAGREDKRAIEHELWTAAGWDGSSQITRLEFQHRGEFLDQVVLRNPDDLVRSLDALWQHDVRWLRLVQLKSATRRSRCELDDRWVSVQAVQFKHSAAPVARVRRRGGASVPHVVGAAVSRAAAAGLFPRINPPTTNSGEVLEGSRLAGMTAEPDAEDWCRAYLGLLFERVGKDAAEHLAIRYGGWKILMPRLLARHNAAVARFTSTDEPSARAPA